MAKPHPTAPAAAAATEPPPYVPNFIQTKMPSGVDLFIITDERDLDEIDKMGISVYYVLGAASRTNGQTGQKAATWEEPTLFKRSKTPISHGLIPMYTVGRTKLPTLKEEAWWQLPSIPMHLVKKIDYFFHTIEEKYHSESIVVLTYDPTFTDTDHPEDGWGCLAPKQENTAGDCKYNPTTIAEMKPEHVIVVGSAHSHPNMSAFASHTDVGDQMDWDGIHITYGWKGKGPTEYHIELQISNKRFNFDPSQVFEDFETETFDVDDMVANVSKKAPTPTTTTYGGYRGGVPGGSNPKALGSGGQSQKHSSVEPNTLHLNSGFTMALRKLWNDKKPAGCPDLTEQVVIFERKTANEANCPLCEEPLDDWSLQVGRCTHCFHYVLDPGETLLDLKERRSKRFTGSKPFMPGLEFMNDGDPVEDVVVWRRAGGQPLIQEAWKKETSPKAEAAKS